MVNEISREKKKRKKSWCQWHATKWILACREVGEIIRCITPSSHIEIDFTCDSHTLDLYIYLRGRCSIWGVQNNLFCEMVFFFPSLLKGISCNSLPKIEWVSTFQHHKSFEYPKTSWCDPVFGLKQNWGLYVIIFVPVFTIPSAFQKISLTNKSSNTNFFITVDRMTCPPWSRLLKSGSGS